MTEAREEEAPQQRHRVPLYLLSFAVVSLFSGIVTGALRKHGVGIWVVVGLALVVMLAIVWPLLARRRAGPGRSVACDAPDRP